MHFDNVGFKGKKKKWSQHTVIQICVIKYEELRKAGFYDSGSLSLERKTFDRLILEIEDETGDKDHNEVSKQRVVGVQKKDWEILSTRVMTSIKTAMELILPDEATCQELLALGEGFSEYLPYPHESWK